MIEHGDDHASRLRRQCLLDSTALIEQIAELGRAQSGFVHRRVRQCQLSQKEIDVVASEIAQPARGQHLVRSAVDIHQRGVESPAPQVVNQDARASRRHGGRLAVRVFETGGAGLIEHSGHVETRSPEGVEREQALRSVRVRGHRDHDICILATRVGAVQHSGIGQLLTQIGEKGDEHVADAQRTITEHHRARRAHRWRRQSAFEAAQKRCTLPSGLTRAETVHQTILGQRGQRRVVVMGVTVRIGEGQDRIVTSVGAGDDRSGRAQVDAEVQVRGGRSTRSTAFPGLGRTLASTSGCHGPTISLLPRYNTQGALRIDLMLLRRWRAGTARLCGAAGEQLVNSQNLAVRRGRPLVTMWAGRIHAARISQLDRRHQPPRDPDPLPGREMI